MPVIDSATDVYAMIGDPVIQTKTPALFNQYCERAALKSVMVPMRIIGADGLRLFVDTLRKTRFLKGLVSTIPHKKDLAGLVDILGPTARRLGVVNAVKVNDAGRLVGDMFDGAGFVNALAENRFDAAGKSVIILGGGAAGSAIGLALNFVGATTIKIVEPASARRDALKKCFYGLDGIALAAQCDDFCSYDLIVNASPLGMNADDPLPGPVDTAKPDALVADAVTSTRITPFLKAAKARGRRIQTGEQMARGHLEALIQFFNL